MSSSVVEVEGQPGANTFDSCRVLCVVPGKSRGANQVEVQVALDSIHPFACLNVGEHSRQLTCRALGRVD